MPPWGRPSGAPRGDAGVGHGRHMVEWAPRPTRSRAWESDDDEQNEDEYAVYIHPDDYISELRDTFAGDELHFTGYDLGRAQGGNATVDSVAFGHHQRYMDERERYQYQGQRQAAYRRHADLVQSAQEKLRKARAKGRTSAKLDLDEIEAIRRNQTPQEERNDPKPKASSKNKSSRSSSSTSHKENKKTSNSRIFSSPSSSASGDRISPKKSRTWDVGMEPQMPSPAGSPAFMIVGPDGAPMYTAPSYPLATREAGRPYQTGEPSRSTSSISEVPNGREPAYIGHYADQQYSPIRGLGPSVEDVRIPRHRSTSNAQEASGYFGPPPVNMGQGRRNVSGPADVSYSKVPRMQARSRLGPVPRDDSSRNSGRQQQWPARVDSRSAPSAQASSDSSSDEDGEGVRVDILADGQGGGYTIHRRPVGGSDGQVRRRKGRE